MVSLPSWLINICKSRFYGLEKDGQSLRKELGAMVNILYRQKIYKDINLVNQLNFFTNYLYHTERVDFSYNGQLNFRVNKLISAKCKCRFIVRSRPN